jgi:hypothetical protein
MEEHLERGTARFQLKAKLERAKMIQMKNSAPRCLDIVPDLEAEDDELSDVDDEDVLEEESSSAPQIRVQVGRRRTHNEQLFVAPCGMVIARETFYGAEAPSTVIVSINSFYPYIPV